MRQLLPCFTGAEVREIADGLNVDLDAAGEVVGFDLTTLETAALPFPATHAG